LHGDGDGKKNRPVAIDGDGDRELFPQGDEDGKPFPDREFPVAIFRSNVQKSLKISSQLVFARWFIKSFQRCCPID
jgi:hypothetical protein